MVAIGPAPVLTEPESRPARRSLAARPALVLLALIVIGGLLRLVLWSLFEHQPLRITDEISYNKLAISLVQRAEYGYDPGQPASDRPPLYPHALAAIYRAVGLEHLQAVRLLQAALSLGTLLVLYQLGATAFSARVGLLAAGLYCFYPSLLGYNNLLLTEVVFTFLLSLACLLLLRALHDRNLLYPAAAGAVLGLAALTRSAAWPLAFVLAPLLLWSQRANLRRAVLAAGLFLAAGAVVLTPWVVRNTTVQQTLILVDTMGGRNFMMGNYRFTPLYRAWDAVSLPDEQSWITELRRAGVLPPSPTQGQIDKLAFQEGFKFALANPGLTLQRDVVKFFAFWGLERELIAGLGAGNFGPVSTPQFVLLTLLLVGSYAAVMLAGLFGLILTPPTDRATHLLLLLVMLLICTVHTVTFGHSRYHLPLIPLVLLYAAAALLRARDLWAHRRCRTFLLACLLCAGLSLSWLWEILVLAGNYYLNALRGLHG